MRGAGDHHAFLHREVHRAHEQIIELRQKIARYESVMKFVLKCYGVGTSPQVYFAMERMQGALDGEPTGGESS